jgi:uncharacterized protein YceK
MKFMFIWQLHPGKLADALTIFSQMTPEQDEQDRGASIKLIGRWHDLVWGRGVAIYETDSAEAISNWALNWNTILDLEFSPVLDDEETRELGKKRPKRS